MAYRYPPEKTVFVEAFRNGTRTDNQVITAAFAALEDGGRIHFGQGKTYTVSAALDLDLTGKNNVLVDGQGATLNAPSMTGYVLTLRGTKTATTTTLTAAVTARSRTLTVSSTTGFAAGDMVSIWSSAELFNPMRADYYKQEMGRVSSVTNSTTLVLESPTWNTYSITGATVTITRFQPVKNLTVQGLRITGANDKSYQFGLAVNNFDGVVIDDVHVSGLGYQGVAVNAGIDATITNSRATDCNTDGYGYGFIASETHSLKIIGCYGARNRHSFDFDTTRDALFLGCTAEADVSSGISTHGNSDVAKIIDCTARDCGGGIIVRGRNTIVRGNHVFGIRYPSETGNQSYIHGINVSGQSGGGVGLAGTNVIVEGNRIDLGGFTDATNGSYGIHVSAPAVNARISDNQIAGFTGHGIYLTGDTNTGVEIRDNRIDCSSQVEVSSWAMGVFVAPANNTIAANISTDIAIERNVISGALHSGIRIQGGYTSSPVTDNIRIRHNRIGSCGTSPVYFDNRYFGGGIQVYGNEVATGAIDTYAGTFVSPPKKGETDVQVFTSSGTWTKPAGAMSVRVRCVGPGGGGGAGARGPSGTALSGGGGGSGGGMSEMTFAASDLTATVSVNIGLGGAGAPGQTVDGSAGAAGSSPATNTTFGSYLFAGRANGGGGGGLAVAGTAGSGSSGWSAGMNSGAAGGAGSAAGAAGAGGGSAGSAGGGGGGGGVTTAPAATAGGAGGISYATYATGGTSGNGANGGNGAALGIKGPSSGGGGGGGSITGNGYNGGNGGTHGAGGGGGGACLNGNTSGAGGNGGDGICIVTTYF